MICEASAFVGLGLLWVAPRRCDDTSLPRAPLDFAVLMALALSLRSVRTWELTGVRCSLSRCVSSIGSIAPWTMIDLRGT